MIPVTPLRAAQADIRRAATRTSGWAGHSSALVFFGSTLPVPGSLPVRIRWSVAQRVHSTRQHGHQIGAGRIDRV